MAGMGNSRLAYLAAALVLVAGVGLAGCSSDSGTDPQPTFDALVKGFMADDFSGVPFDGDRVTPELVKKQYDEAVAGLGDVKPHVTIATTHTGGSDAASATLHWTWPIGDGWSYSSKVPLVTHDQGDTWAVPWKVGIIHPSLAAGDTLDATTVGATRADILGPHGVGLITERPVVRFGVDRLKVGAAQAPDSARRLAQLVGIDAAPYVKQVKAAGDKAFVQAIAFRRDEVPPAVMAQYNDIKGVDAIADDVPLGITKEFAAPILGSVGPVTAEILKDNPGVYSVGDDAGLSGLEARYDEQLRGTPGVAIAAVDPDGKKTTLFRADPVDGTPLHLTLEPRLQLLAERILSTVKPASAIVAIKPSTGAIVAAANGPGNNGYNDATYGRFAPGSTFKTVSTLALLKNGVRPSSPVDCPTSVNVDGKVFTNDSFYPPSANGRITLATALANSCNTAYINERTHLGSNDLVDAAATLGMGVDHDLGFPAYFGNVVPPTSETDQGGRHDRPGADPRLTDDDGDGDGVGRGRPHGRSAADHVGEPRHDQPRAAHRRPGHRAQGHAARRRPPRHGRGAARHPRPAGDRQDRHRGVRPRRPAPDPRLDGRGLRRPRGLRLRRRRSDRCRHRRPSPRAVPAGDAGPLISGRPTCH